MNSIQVCCETRRNTKLQAMLFLAFANTIPDSVSLDRSLKPTGSQLAPIKLKLGYFQACSAVSKSSAGSQQQRITHYISDPFLLRKFAGTDHPAETKAEEKSIYFPTCGGWRTYISNWGPAVHDSHKRQVGSQTKHVTGGTLSFVGKGGKTIWLLLIPGNR